MFVEQCRELIEKVLPEEFPTDEAYTIVHNNPERILEGTNLTVKLYAQVIQGDESIRVLMRMPGITSALKRLADLGVGNTTDHQGVRYQFINLDPHSGTTTPITHLS